MFFERLRTWFPTIYDIKFMMRACKVLKGGLQDVADDLGVMLHWSVLALATTNGCFIAGHANRSITSSRLRFAIDRIHVLQNAGNIL